MKDELKKARSYEGKNKNRKTLVRWLDARIEDWDRDITREREASEEVSGRYTQRPSRGKT